MSEEARSRLYAWLCEQTDESQAEYVMSCLAPAPLSDLVTKDFLTAELSKFATKSDLAELDTKVTALDTKVTALDASVAHLAEQRRADRAEDRRASQVRHYWLVSIGLSIAVPIWLSTAGLIG